MNILIDNIICDVRERTNPDVTELYSSLLKHGQIEALLVEGPNQDGKYYIIHGCRRLRAMKQNKSTFREVKCNVHGNITSTRKRNALRCIIISNLKKATGLDQQLVYEELECFPQRESLIPKSKQKRMEKGYDVPQEVRIKYEKRRRSQDALALIYNLEGLGTYREELLNLLLNGKITTVHGDAIKRIVKEPLYNELNRVQKINVIDYIIKNVKFTDNKANFLILEQIMKKKPQKRNIHSWIEFICDQMEGISELIHKDLESLTTHGDRLKLRRSLEKWDKKLKWVNEEKKEYDISSPLVNEQSQQETVKKPKTHKRLVVIEKRNGNKITFSFH
ncbi:ParB/Srx family N-terminal domain-containing protein [Priestia megaterium]|uniref:ParB/Srx family N-terminal domain-containing protein n=1 Tax=Priestia megaterium TaxID=1404 RepID=UPI001C2138A5|nr:ParB/Srx family N-terminal domain-containing protein [Priestia megaterium]MBU8852756.1 ParB/Srx family N-terminal domain-containing protein [Bacillus sp. FJAT-26377]MCU7738872.1 ParB/Srx family N-terminal domain-containing protein [Priestia megaterium]